MARDIALLDGSDRGLLLRRHIDSHAGAWEPTTPFGTMHTLGNVAYLLGFGQRHLVRLLRYHGVLGANGRPAHQFVEKGYFAVAAIYGRCESAPPDLPDTPKALISDAGIAFLRTLTHVDTPFDDCVGCRVLLDLAGGACA